ncbi:MAG: FGGY-family carbohydrate kinase, partial [Treponemataceae bacterium]
DDGDDNFRKMAASVAALSPTENCPVFLPYMAGERSPVWDPRARGVFFGLSLHTKREQIARAVFESCAFGDRQLIEIAESMTGTKIDEVLCIGGWSMVDDWNKIKADVAGRAFCSLDLPEAAVVGAALLGGMASGLYSSFADAAGKVEKKARKRFTPDPAFRASYDKRYSIYTDLYPRLKELFKRWEFN